MHRILWLLAAAGALILTGPAFAQKSGGVLKVQHWDSPASMSIHEEATYSTVVPIMGVMNNLVLYKQDVPQNSLQSIVPDLAEGWTWSEDGKELTFKLRQGVKWHDGKAFTAKDVQCTWDLLMGKGEQKFRGNPRKAWYRNLDKVTADNDQQVSFHLKRPQPAFITAGFPLFAAFRATVDVGRDAAASGRHRPVQIRRVQA
jgi:peptide/nickel transport system substrate-binding protein